VRSRILFSAIYYLSPFFFFFFFFFFFLISKIVLIIENVIQKGGVRVRGVQPVSIMVIFL
jgi:lipopolysaccharide export LptBFGC system permease protein LptF